GLIAGGIQLHPVVDNKTPSKTKKDVVLNEFAYLVGMLLRVGNTDSIKPELKLNKTYIAFKESKSHLFVNISNIRPVYVEGMTVDIQVKKANKQKMLFEYQKKAMRMAPNSIIDLPVDLADKGMTAGDYSARINVISKDGDKWSWTEDFKVNVLEASEFNKKTIENKMDNKLILLVFILFLCMSGLVLIFSLIVMKHNRKNVKMSK
ncbi:DUF3324 domain-containing protein, partial [Enterococcus haemoperoxidus]